MCFYYIFGIRYYSYVSHVQVNYFLKYSKFLFQEIFIGRQLKLNSELNNMSWRVRPDEVLLEVGKLFGSKMGLQKLNYENFSIQHFGSGRASIASCTSLPPTQLFTTIGIYKGERVAIKKIFKKKVQFAHKGITRII